MEDFSWLGAELRTFLIIHRMPRHSTLAWHGDPSKGLVVASAGPFSAKGDECRRPMGGVLSEALVAAP